VNTNREVQNFANFIKDEVKPLLELFTREFSAGTDVTMLSFRGLLDSSARQLATVAYWIVEDHRLFRELHRTCETLLRRDGILDGAVTVLAKFLRKRVSSISVKKRVSEFALAFEKYNRFFVPIILLSSLDLARWPFNEAETANVMIAISMRYHHESPVFGEIIEVFRVYESAGIDLSHLNPEEIVKKLHGSYLFSLSNLLTVALFFYRNEDFRNTFLSFLKVRAVVNDSARKEVITNIRKIENCVKVLKILLPPGTQTKRRS